MTRAKCLTCGERFSGPRDKAFRWLMFHGVLHQLQTTAVQRVAKGAAFVAAQRAV